MACSYKKHCVYFICRSYRLAAYREFIYWTHLKLGKGIRKVIPSCIVAIRHEFPEANNIFGYKIYREL